MDKPIRTNADKTAAIRRMIAALGRSCANGDPEDLAGLLSLHATVDQAAQVAVDGMRGHDWTWRGIAEATGHTREAACQRWGRPKVLAGDAPRGRVDGLAT